MILLIFPNPSPVPYHAMTPLAIFSIGTYLEQRGIEVEYFDERVQKRSELDRLLSLEPELVGVSVLTSFQIFRGLFLTRYVKNAIPEVPVVWGGNHPSMCPEQTLSEDLIDFVVIREGEETLRELFESVRTEETELGDIEGLGWKTPSGRLRINRERPFLPFSEMPFPFQGKARELLPLYLHPGAGFPTVGYQMSRGCPYNCRFCYNDFYHHRRCRRKSPAVIKEELDQLRELGVDNIFFCDDSMGGEKSFLQKLVPVLEASPIKWSASPRITSIDEKLIGEFERVGCQWLFFGIESPLNHMLRYIGKGITKIDIDRGVEIMRKSKIITTYSLMVGFPEETYQDSLAVLDFADELHRRHPSAEIVVQPYAPLPGTDLYQESLAKGFQPPLRLIDWSRFTMDRIHTPWLKARPFFKNVYLTSFLAFRYEHMLGDLKQFRWIYALVHEIARWRWRHRRFGFYLEGTLYRLYTRYQYWRGRK